MNKALGILLIVLIAMGCQTSAFDPPEFGPFFKADVVFSNGTSFNASAGVDDYYMFTKGYKANDLKLYSSTLSPDQNCTGNCNEQLTLNIYQGEPNGTINSLDQLDFYSTNDQNVIHTLEASKDDNEVYNSVWRVNKDQESTLSQIEFNQEYGETDDINVNLVYSNEHKSFVRFGQTFSPLAEEDFSISVDLTREPNGTILAKVVDDGNIEFIKWNDNQSNFIRVFTGGSLNASFNVISKTGQHVNCTIKIPEGHPAFEPINLGYTYTNEVVPEINLEDVSSGEVVYTDANGNEYRSSYVSQILPSFFKINSLEPYLDNEEGIPTYSAEVEFKCLVFCPTTGKTKYISEGVVNFAFVEEI